MLEFDEATHTYRLDGQVLPSVTQIIRFLNYDTAENAKSWLRDVAADRGSRVHAYTADIDMGAEPENYDWDCVGYIQAYKSFLRDYNPQWTHIEAVAGSLELGYAGTIDRIGRIDGETTIVDFKTGSKIHVDALTAQLHGYTWLAMNNKLCDSMPKRLGVQLKRDGTYRLFWCELDFDIWNACMTIHKKLEKIS